jgi:protein SCO1/2
MMLRSALCLFALLGAVKPAAGQSSDTPSAANEGIEQRLGEQVPLQLSFRDETGQTVKLGSYFGKKPVVLVLAYFRCPRLCDVVLNGMTDGLRELTYEMEKDYTVLTVSFDPREGPDLAAEKKKAYAERYRRPGTDNGWHFLTGEEDQIRRLAEAVGFRYSYDPKKNEYAHGSGIMILTPKGKVSCYFYGIDFPPDQLAYGLEDASAGTIRAPLTRPLRLLCFGYDPITGRYTLMVMKLVRLAGLLTVLVLAVGLWRMWRRDRRRGDKPLALEATACSSPKQI